MSLVLGLGLEHFCPWPRECLSSERLSLALTSEFFCVLGLGLKPCVLDSTSVTQTLKKFGRNRPMGSKDIQLDGSLPANPINNRRVTLKSTFCLPQGRPTFFSRGPNLLFRKFRGPKFRLTLSSSSQTTVFRWIL